MSTQNALDNTLATTSLTGTLQATNFLALTGDVTNSAGTVATTIAANAVTTTKINNAAVTYAKMQAETASTLLGNPTGSGASPSEITLGTGLSFSGSVLNASGAAFAPMPATVVTTTTQAASTNNAYVSNNAALVTITLPTTAAVGDENMVMGLGAGGFTIAQNAGQNINFGNVSTTTGTGGSISSQNQFDTIHIKCLVANTTYTVIASQGNMTVV